MRTFPKGDSVRFKSLVGINSASNTLRIVVLKYLEKGESLALIVLQD